MKIIFAVMLFSAVMSLTGAAAVISLRQHRINMISGGLKSGKKRGAGLFLFNIREYIVKFNEKAEKSSRYKSIKEKLRKLDMDKKYSAGEFLFMEQTCAAAGFFVMYAASLDLFFSAAGAAAGFFAPSFIVNSKLKKQNEAVLKELPDAIDIIGANIEGGLSIQKAVERYAARNKGVFSGKLITAVNETGLGKSFSEAMEKLDRMSDIPEVSSFASAFIQAEKMGGNVKQIIKAQSEEIRNKRFLYLKKKAHEAPVKLLFPLMVFIFPVVFMILFTPIIIKLLSGAM
ncbi:MAG: type II secretion system F family protein [Candidatus Goldiibacteriota bacterium]